MFELSDFFGRFGDFQTLDLDATLSKYVFCVHGPNGDIEAYKMIVGWTQLPYDYLLHIISAENLTTDHIGEEFRSYVNGNGIEFIFLKDFIGAYGAEIHPDFQPTASQ